MNGAERNDVRDDDDAGETASDKLMNAETNFTLGGARASQVRTT